MNSHILRLVLNRRKDFVWIFLEQILVFVVLFYCFTEVYSKLEQYLDPGNLAVDYVCSLGILPDNGDLLSDKDWADFARKEKYVMDKVENSTYIEAVHRGYYTIPGNRPSSNNRKDSLAYKGKKYPFYVKTSDANFQRVFRVKMLEGTWFRDEAFADGTYPVVLTKSLVEELALDNPLGTRLNYEGREFTVCGIMNDYKSFLFDNVMPSALFANSAFEGDEKIADRTEVAMLIKKGQMSEFINYFWQEAQKTFPGEGHQYYVYDLGLSKNGETSEVTMQVVLIAVIPTMFLTIFAFLGIFSLMYRQSKKSIGEYGLRMALGSTKTDLKIMVLKQALIMTGLAAIVGSIIGFNLHLFLFPEADLIILSKSVLTTLALMLLFSIVSVWYPAQVASKTRPAIALKQED